MSQIIRSTLEMVSTMARLYFTCPENPAHVRHYVDPITGHAIPMKNFKN